MSGLRNIHQAENLDQRRLRLQWWADYLDANRDESIRPFEFAQRQNSYF